MSYNKMSCNCNCENCNCEKYKKPKKLSTSSPDTGFTALYVLLGLAASGLLFVVIRYYFKENTGDIQSPYDGDIQSPYDKLTHQQIENIRSFNIQQIGRDGDPQSFRRSDYV